MLHNPSVGDFGLTLAKVAKLLVLVYFWPLLKRATLIVMAKIGSKTKPYHHPKLTLSPSPSP